MSASAEDYIRATERVVRDLRPLGDDLVSAYLYGSTARGDMKLGKSDIDVEVILRNSVWESQETFSRAIEVLEGAARGLLQSGTPFEGLLYTAADEMHFKPASWCPEYSSSRDTRLLAGKDMAAELRDPIPMAQLLREALYVMVFPATANLVKDELSPEERSEVAGLLDMVWKYVPSFACAAAGTPCTKREARATLRSLFPDLDLSVLDELQLLRESEGVPESAEIKVILKRALVLIEELHRIVRGRAKT